LVYFSHTQFSNSNERFLSLPTIANARLPGNLVDIGQLDWKTIAEYRFIFSSSDPLIFHLDEMTPLSQPLRAAKRQVSEVAENARTCMAHPLLLSSVTTTK
jgi:hypothetical protein